MKRLKNLGSFSSVVFTVLSILPSTCGQFQTFEWPGYNAHKWENFNSLFTFESSRISPHSPQHQADNSLIPKSKPQNHHTHQFFNIGPKQEPEIIHPDPSADLIHSNPSMDLTYSNPALDLSYSNPSMGFGQSLDFTYSNPSVDPSGAELIPSQARKKERPGHKIMNITDERLGGYGGSGDLRGYGAYEYKHKPKDSVYPGMDILRTPTKKLSKRKKPFVHTFFDILPMEDV